MTLRICVNCKFYKEMESEEQDQCTHERSAQFDLGVRLPTKITYYYCKAMLVSYCNHHALFEEKQ